MRVMEKSLKLMKSLERLNLSLIKMEETFQMVRIHHVKDELGGH